MPNIGETEEGVVRPGDGWLECIGLSVRRDEFPELFEKIGSRHGSLNSAHFNLPSIPHTYIYAGGAASKIAPTPPSLPGDDHRMMPVDVPPSPIMSVSMEPRGAKVGPEDTHVSILPTGGAPGSKGDLREMLAQSRTVAQATGTERTDDIQKTAAPSATKAVEAQAEEAAPQTESQKAQRAAADARVAARK